MHGSPRPKSPRDSVAIECRDDKYVVVVIEDGEVAERTFILEAHAASYADGQRIRLGLKAS
ncbi:MAG: hypothetical protein EOP84_18420 [Verrucomicrobiaceae bacterium]|nr:MAG: hypothetical protein EOP84_18420 [Verrucomicrobiaceae bacterium]